MKYLYKYIYSLARNKRVNGEMEVDSVLSLFQLALTDNTTTKNLFEVFPNVWNL